jgi:hypothetical protein
MANIARSHGAGNPSRRPDASQRYRKAFGGHDAKPAGASVAVSLTPEEQDVLGLLPCALSEISGAATAIGFRRFEAQTLLNALLWTGMARLRVGHDGRILVAARP